MTDVRRAGSSVVVGIDGSVSALEASRWAAREAERRRVRLRLMSASAGGPRATSSRPEPADLPDSSGLIHYDGFTKGTMTLLAPDRARFDVTDPLVKPIPGGVEFTPTDETPALCQ